MPYLVSIFALLSLLISSTAQAHPVWMLPNQFVVSSEQPEWITVDLTASNTFFSFDHGVSAEQVAIYSPDGKKQPLDSFYKGHLRSVFDVQLSQDGTYKLELQRPPIFFTFFNKPEESRPQRLFANKQQAAAQLPAGATDVKTVLINLRSATYLTNNKPNLKVFEPTGKGLELQPITHPNDIIRGETVSFQLLLDGVAAKGIKVELTPGGTAYRDKRGETQAVTDEEGKFSFTPEQAGPWLLFADHTQPSATPMADEQRTMLYITLEVIAE